MRLVTLKYFLGTKLLCKRVYPSLTISRHNMFFLPCITHNIGYKTYSVYVIMLNLFTFGTFGQLGTQAVILFHFGL